MQRGTSTRVPALLPALQELIGAKAPSGVEVRLGEEPGDAADELIMLAPADPDTPGLAVTYGVATDLGRAPVEQVEVAFVCRSYAGNGTIQDRIARCGAMLEAVRQVVAENPQRNNAWDKIEMGPTALWHPVYTDAGVNCYVGGSIVTTGLI